MEPVHLVHVRVVEHAGRDHRLGTADHLLRGLEDEDGRARDLRPARGHDLGHRDGDRRMPVVATRVHHARLPRGERRLEPLGERQGVDVGPPGDGAARPIAVENADHARPRDARPHLELGAVQPLGDDLGGAPLLERQLGMAVEVPPEGDEPVLPLVHFLRPLDRRLRHGHLLRSSVGNAPSLPQDRDLGPPARGAWTKARAQCTELTTDHDRDLRRT